MSINEINHFLFGTGVLAAWVQLIPMALSLGSSILSGVQTSKLNKQRDANLAAEKSKQDAIFNQEYYTPELDRTENKAMLGVLNDKMKEQTKQNANTAAITGATAETKLAAQDDMNKNYADTVRAMAGNASIRKSNLLAGKQQQDMQMYQLKDNIDQAKTQNWANLSTQAQTAASGMNSFLSKNYDAMPKWAKWSTK